MTVLELCGFSTHLFPPGTPLLETNGASLISRISSAGELSLTCRGRKLGSCWDTAWQSSETHQSHHHHFHFTLQNSYICPTLVPPPHHNMFVIACSLLLSQEIITSHTLKTLYPSHEQLQDQRHTIQRRVVKLPNRHASVFKKILKTRYLVH